MNRTQQFPLSRQAMALCACATLSLSLPAASMANDNDALRSIDGSGNNHYHSEYGQADTPLLRNAPVGYADKISIPNEEHKKSPREISNAIAAQEGEVYSHKRVSGFVWQWGQFLDHDIDLTPDSSGEFFPVHVPTGDPWFDPYAQGGVLIPLLRSQYTGGTHRRDPRQQTNVITAFVDASNVYGSDPIRANALRTFEGGLLKTSNNGLFLPHNTDGLPNAGGDDDAALFLAGDIRANEQVGLIAMHTLFVREHNRLCAQIKKHHPQLSDEQLYQYARKIVGAQVQVITYNEFLPVILGQRNKLPRYRGYRPNVNPSIANEFSSAAYRFGHSLLNEEILIVDHQNNETSSIPLAAAFFHPEYVQELGDITPILLGLANMHVQEVDTKVVNAIRNFLFGPPGAGGLDLVALNIQRGRDHGLANYNRARRAYGLAPKRGFKQVTDDVELRKKLKNLYGKVRHMDLWVGGLAEDHLPGAMVGETFHTIISDQFTRLRDGDRFWYQHDPFFKKRPWLKRYVKHTRLSDIIVRNTTLQHKHLQRNVFKLEGARYRD